MNRFGKRQTQSRKGRPLTLGLQALERRALMHADVDLTAGQTLDIAADPRGSTVEVSNFFAGKVIVTSTDRSGNVERSFFDRSKVELIVFHGSDLADHYTNNTSIHDRVYGNGGDDILIGGQGTSFLKGGSGNDTLRGRGGDDTIHGDSGNDKIYGGEGSDTLRGGSGDDTIWGDGLWGRLSKDFIYGNDGGDTLYGGGGNDEIHGGDGNDKLFGGAGGDTLRGGAGVDTLRGGYGDDSLYGGSGWDFLDGEAGNDGLFGGAGFDVLIGGGGADRFLQHTASTDWLLDVGAVDAVIEFRDGNQITAQFSGIGGSATFAAGRFTDAEIEALDVALDALHDRIGGTDLLKLHDGSRLSFVRHGDLLAGTAVGAWNARGTIHLVPDSFGGDWLNLVIVHEVGHNWDDPSEYEGVDTFRQLSGWTSLPVGIGIWSSGAHFVHAADTSGEWWYRSTAQFATAYGATNPLEDLATIFEAYFATRLGWTAPEAGTLQTVASKFAYLDRFFDELAG